MQNKTPIIIGAFALLIVLAGAGAYFLSSKNSSGGGPGPGNGGTPTSIKVFQVQKPNFVIQGENLGKVEVWKVEGGQESVMGSAVKQAGASNTGAGETWTMPIPAGASRASAIFARGYSLSGEAAARMDLSPTEIKNL